MDSACTQQVQEKYVEGPPSDDRLLVKWLEGHGETLQTELTIKKIEELLGNAAQPRHASGNACIKLCYFIEQCRKSESPRIRDISSSQKTCLDLFNFYIEWNEKNQNRSMRQVLELLASLISQHPQIEISLSLKESILAKLVSIITHRAAQPLVKPAFKSLECFLSKSTISPQNLIDVYEHGKISRNSDTDLQGDLLTTWDSLISDISDWLTLPDVSPAAGKCLVTLFGQLRSPPSSSERLEIDHSSLWQRWIRKSLTKNPDALENVKNYLFPPLFKLDRSGSLAFLEDLNKQKPMTDFKDQELNAHSLLQLAAIEVGKKAGLVDEPNTIGFDIGAKKKSRSVMLQERVIAPLLAHAVDTVRSLAFSVLVSSSSSIRPFNSEALDIFRSSMGVLYADTDAKFRNEVLSTTKHLIERLRGATAYLVREIQSFSFTALPGTDIRQHKNQNQVVEVSKLLSTHQSFTQWYLEFLLAELIPTASYQRHITSLKAITLFLKSGILRPDSKSKPAKVADNATIWPYNIKFFTSGTMRLLLDLLMDPFEDVRIQAADVLKLAPREAFANDGPAEYVEMIVKPTVSNLGDESHLPSRTSNGSAISSAENGPLGLLTKLISRADNISKRTGRADYADGLARSYALLYGLLPSTTERLALVDELILDLEQKTNVAGNDLSRAVSDAPIHGTFAALNFIWESIHPSGDNLQSDLGLYETETNQSWNKAQLRIMLTCSSIWQAVKDVLCNDSPEGHLPEDLDEMPSIDTKDVLSYSFRAVHESSNLMRTLVSKIKGRWQNGSPILPTEIFLGIGQLTFEQLSSLRHRGAFSTVSLTFAKCCHLAQHQNLGDSPDLNILEKWYKGAIACIFEQASTTRRSAGIPALITGILSANGQSPRFEDVITELISLAEQPAKLSEQDQTNLPQVHAINCLKEIFKSSILGKRAESHIADCLQLAADSLNSDIWAIRNCGLLLLRSLIDCLFGTSESKSVTEAGWDGRSIRLSYERYPSLPTLLLKLLETDTSSSSSLAAPIIGAVESVFPALDILRRAGPPSTHRDEIYRCVSMHLGSKIWHIREIAARTLCTLMLHSNWLRDVLELLVGCEKSANRLHGVLLAVKFILERRLVLDPTSAIDGLPEIAAALENASLQIDFQIATPEILATYLEVYNTFAEIVLEAPKIVSSPGLDSPFEFTIRSHFSDSPAEKLLLLKKDSDGFNGALGNAIIRRGVYASALTDDVESLQKILQEAAGLNADITLIAIECASQSWRSCSSSVALDLVKVYLDLIAVTESSEVSSATILVLAETIERRCRYVKLPRDSTVFSSMVDDDSQAISLGLSRLQTSVRGRKGTPSLSNAQIRISGAVPLFKEMSKLRLDISRSHQRYYLEPWGRLLSASGEANNDFDTRHAAAVALATFYGNSQIDGYVCKDKHTIPSLNALYDTLNDDDDEIRDLGASTVSVLLKRSLVPIAAQVEFAKWLSAHHRGATFFAWNVVSRMTGSIDYEAIDGAGARLQSAENQFLKAMKDDDSLFVEEEQNLFIDEIRETKVWCEIFETVSINHSKAAEVTRTWIEPQKVLAEWVLEGLEVFNNLLVNADGPLGWSSKPAVFSICMRIILSANAILRQTKGLQLEADHSDTKERIANSLENFISLGKEKRIHERLLFEVDGQQE